MWGMAKNSILLFIQGRLFKDVGKVLRQILICAFFTAFVFIVAMAGLSLADVHLGSANIWIASAIAGLLGGMLQPYLFKDLKYA